MNIGIIGIGQIGGSIAQKLAQAGHTFKIANSKGIDSVADFAQAIKATPADLQTVGVGVDVLILSIPTPAIADLPVSLWAGLWAGLSSACVVVDTANYYPEFRDKAISQIDNGMAESLWVSRVVGRGVVKAFNMLLAHSLANLGKPKGEPNRLAMWVAGDDESQKQRVMSLVDECVTHWTVAIWQIRGDNSPIRQGIAQILPPMNYAKAVLIPPKCPPASAKTVPMLSLSYPN